ncbi:MAG: VCBS repeat-containing protein [candidate division Zixibacteria bacterium]|nr:VCBS repeat-containing protein [candidate division Zixibacteria bacterium]
MKKLIVYISIFATLLLTLSVVSQAADDDIFSSQQISVSGEIFGIQNADFNGDSLNDIALVIGEPSGERTLNIFLQRETGRFPPTISQRIILSHTVNMIQAADLDGNGKSEILVVNHQGVLLYSHDGEKFNDNPRMVINHPTIFTGGIKGSILKQKFLYMISGRLIAFVPVVDGFELFGYENNHFAPVSQLGFSHAVYSAPNPVKLFIEKQTIFSTIMPEVVISDYNKDDLADVYVLWPTRLEIFPQNIRHEFSPTDKLTFNFSKYSRDNLCQSQLVDFDRDGILDLICIHSVGGLSEALTEVRFFGASQILNNDKLERHLINLTDVCGNLIVGDFDGVGGPELVVTAIELGILTTVKNMISKKADFYFLVYPIDNLGRPAKEPKVRRKVTCRLDFEKADPTGDFCVNWSGDYNKDGFLDLVTADGEKMMFYRGVAEEYTEKKAGLVLDIAAVDHIITAQLNNDGNTDLIVIHKPGADSHKITLLVTNRIY